MPDTSLKDTGSESQQPLLDVQNLHVEFDTYGGIVKAVRGASFSVNAGQTLAIVGESGCGKSVTVQSIMGLIPMPPGRITQGQATLRGEPIIGRSRAGGRAIRGDQIGMIFQDPMTSLNPTMTIGDQIAETLIVHRGQSKSEAAQRAIELLDLARIPEAKQRARQYPFEFSGGMLQRAMIATAIACEPDLLIADEPTTALDVTIQAQILDLLNDLQRETGMAIVLITHDLGVVARMADDVVVMYAGQVVERGGVDNLFYHSAHPYTLGLRAAMPTNIRPAAGAAADRLTPIDGSPPDLFAPPAGCGYCARCPYAMQVCKDDAPPVFDIEPGHYARCWLQHEAAPRQADGLHRAHAQSQKPSGTPDDSRTAM